MGLSPDLKHVSKLAQQTGKLWLVPCRRIVHAPIQSVHASTRDEADPFRKNVLRAAAAAAGCSGSWDLCLMLFLMLTPD